MADLLPAIELVSASNPAASVIWLHGLGADGNDFVSIAEDLGLPPQLVLRFIFPHAPMQAVTLNSGMVMRAWYDISASDLSLREDEAGVRASQREIEKLIAREKQRGIAANKIVLAGFSQGGAIALQTGLRYPERLAGLVALSGYLLLPDVLRAEATAANRSAPIFQAHGTHDPMVPCAMARVGCEHLVAAGYAAEWHEYPM
ncbi:MAG: alpha/beta hydrolase, partial [Burkholderiales bacterium]